MDVFGWMADLLNDKLLVVNYQKIKISCQKTGIESQESG